MHKLITVFALILFSFQTFAKSLEWQRIELEETINSKYSSALAGVLKSPEYLVKTQVKYNDPGMPDFQDLNKSDFKISDLPFDESKGDYIAFAKVGLEVPVVGKMFQDHQRKLKELYRYNESFDLFKNIQNIDVLVSVSDKISEQKLEVVKNIVKNVEFSVAGFTPKVEVKSENIQAIDPVRAPAEESLSMKDILDFLGKFGNAIGLIAAVALFMYLAFKLLRMYMEFLEKLKGMEEPKSEEESEVKEEEEEEEPVLEVSEEEVEEDESEKPSFDRFEKLLALNAKQAGILLKRWLKKEDDESSMILTAIAQQLDTDSLELLFKELNPQEREVWNSYIKGYLDKESLDRANALISEGVIKELVGGSFVDDHELVDLILGMSSDSVKSYILKGGEYGKVLANMLNPEVISEILNEISIEEMDKIISESMDFSFSDLGDSFEAFKSDLKHHCETANTKPFNLKLLQVISEVGPEKEGMLYRHMAGECSKSDLVSVAKKHFPSDLVLEMPKSFLKLAMQNYAMEKKIPLLASLDEEKRTGLMDSFLEEGSNAKEMVMMELETVTEDELQLKRIQSVKDSIWKEFLNYIREAVKHDEDHRSELEMLISTWVDELQGEIKGQAAA